MRREGWTTAAMRAAPDGAVYVWVNSHLAYPRALARSLGRTDLLVVSPGWVRASNLQGRRVPIVVDHAARLTGDQLDELWHYYQRALDWRKTED